MLRDFLLVGAGGAFGSILRYAVILALPHTERGFPWATFSVNLIGCFCIGLLAGLQPKIGWLGSIGWALLATGVCGGFTTFSAFTLDGIKLVQSGAAFTAMVYVIGSVLLGILLCYAGFVVSTARVS